MSMLNINRREGCIFIKIFIVMSLILSGCSNVKETAYEIKTDTNLSSMTSSSVNEKEDENDHTVMTNVNNEITKESKADNVANIDYSPYYALIEELKNGLKKGFTEEQKMGLDVTSCFFYTDPSYERIGYMIKDIDGNGVDELLFGANAPEGNDLGNAWDNIIYDVYTIKDGKMLHTVKGWERNRYYMCDKGLIANEGSSGAAYTCYNFYNYMDDELKIIESVYTDVIEDESVWRHSQKEAYEEEGAKVITGTEAEKIKAGYKYQKLDFTPFLMEAN